MEPQPLLGVSLTHEEVAVLLTALKITMTVCDGEMPTLDVPHYLRGQCSRLVAELREVVPS